MSTALFTVDLAEHVRLGQGGGLAAGLARILRDLSHADIVAAAPGRFVAVPAQRAFAEVVEHSMAAAEGIAVLALPDAPTGPTGRTVEIGLRLAAVRVGLTRRLLDQAVEHLTGRVGGGEPLIRKQLNQGTVADVLAALELLRRHLETAVLDPSADLVADVHAQLGDLDWEVTKLFGASGYLTDHDVRALYVAGLVANTWVSEGTLP